VNLQSKINVLADQCVKCGLCLPYCPTYAISLNEAESPRGRIAMCQTMVTQNITQDDSLLRHLGHCLQCRNCERACPSAVEYNKIYTSTYQWLRQQQQPQAISLFARVLTHPWLTQLVYSGAWLYQRLGVQWLLRHSGLLKLSRLKQYDGLLPPLHADALPPFLAAKQTRRGTIALFTGCLGRYFEREAILATARIAAQAGYDVIITTQQVCCGAMQHNHGDVAHTMQLAKTNLDTLGTQEIDAILFLTTGCGAQLLNYHQLPWQSADEQQRANNFVSKLHEACAWVHANATLPIVTPINTTVLVQQPCSHRNVVGNPQVIGGLLGKITRLNVEPLIGKLGCCGAAGDYMLREPELAEQIRQPMLDNIKNTTASYLVTTNLGCALYLRAGLQDRGQAITITHPLTLYARATGCVDH
jgi:glycolate oxidase iron-sulfur subunit